MGRRSAGGAAFRVEGTRGECPARAHHVAEALLQAQLTDRLHQAGGNAGGLHRICAEPVEEGGHHDQPRAGQRRVALDGLRQGQPVRSFQVDVDQAKGVGGAQPGGFLKARAPWNGALKKGLSWL